MTETSREQDIERRLNQDFVAHAPYHMPIEVVSVRVREHQHLERTPSGVVFWPERREVQHAWWGGTREWRNSRKAEGRPKGAVEPRKLSNRRRETEIHRWTDNTASNLNRCWEQRAQAGQFIRKEWIFCLALQFFKAIAILWRNSSICEIAAERENEEEVDRKWKKRVKNMWGSPELLSCSSVLLFTWTERLLKKP